MIKKIIPIIITLFFLLPSTTIAAGSCSISDGPSPELLEYIQNIRKIVSNVTSEAVTSSVTYPEKDYGKIKASTIKIFNQVTTWEGYESTFIFYVQLPLTSMEIPYEVKRDNTLIENEIKGLSNYLTKIIERGSDESIIANACDGVSATNCDLNGKMAKDIIGELIKETTKLGDSYRLSIAGKIFNKDIKFGGINFIQMWNYYTPDTLSSCSFASGSFGSRIDKAISSITLNNKKGQYGIKLWEDAIALLLGTSADYEKTEASLLENELGRQGISSKSSKAMLNNLKKYNKTGGYSAGNNFVSNSFNTLKKNIGGQLQEFSNSLSEMMKDDPSLPKGELQKSIKQIAALGEKNDTTLSIVNRVGKMYQSELPFAQLQDNSTQQFQGRLIKMHGNITSTINILEKIIPISEKVCNDQDSGEGLCSVN